MAALRRLAALPAGRRTKWVVIAIWLIAVALAWPASGRLGSVEQNDPSFYLPGGAESTRVLQLQQRFPGGDNLPAVVVYLRGSGLTQADLAKARSDAQQLRAQDFVAGQVTGPVRSDDGRAAQLIVPIRAAEGGTVADDVSTVRQIAARDTDAVTHVTGPAGVQADTIDVFETIDSTLLSSTLVVVVALLLLTYRSPFLWIPPVLTAGVCLISAQAVNYLLARYAGLVVNGQSVGILLVLVFGAGTDYALLLIARYREELRRHTDPHEAMALALRHAGPAVWASGTTVILALLCLLAAELDSNRSLGPVAAIGVGCVLLAMTTLLPALLVLVGRRAFWPFVPHLGTHGRERRGLWGRLGAAVARHPRPVWLGTAAALAVMCLGLVTLDTTGLSNQQAFRTNPDSVQGERVLADHFPAGLGSPAVVIGRATQTDALTDAVRATRGVAQVPPPRRSGPLVEVDAVLAAPPDSQPAFDTVDRLRARIHAVPDAQASVGGTSAVSLDIRRATSHDTRVIIPAVLAVVLCVLAVLLRALVASAMLTATVVLSYGAATGLCAFAFDVIFGFGGSDPAFPLFTFIFLVALGIDYNIFLMTRVREEARTRPTTDAVVAAVAVTGGVITAAGVVLAATFLVLGVLPLVALTQIGLTVAFGVLLDALVVRTILVPALTVQIGRTVWWPSRLARPG